MLFNSYGFLFGFLPLTILGFVLLNKIFASKKISICWLVAASLFFYSWWNPPYVILLISSVAINFFFGRLLNRSRSKVCDLSAMACPRRERSCASLSHRRARCCQPHSDDAPRADRAARRNRTGGPRPTPDECCTADVSSRRHDVPDPD